MSGCGDTNFQTKEVIVIPNPQGSLRVVTKGLGTKKETLQYPCSSSFTRIPSIREAMLNIWRSLVDYNFYDIVFDSQLKEGKRRCPRDFHASDISPCIPKPVKRRFLVLSCWQPLSFRFHLVLGWTYTCDE